MREPSAPHAAGALQGGYLFTIVTNIRAAIGTCSAHADGQALRSERLLEILRPSPLSEVTSSPRAGLAGWVWARRTAETTRLCRHPPGPPFIRGRFVPRHSTKPALLGFSSGTRTCDQRVNEAPREGTTRTRNTVGPSEQCAVMRVPRTCSSAQTTVLRRAQPPDMMRRRERVTEVWGRGVGLLVTGHVGRRITGPDCG